MKTISVYVAEAIFANILQIAFSLNNRINSVKNSYFQIFCIPSDDDGGAVELPPRKCIGGDFFRLNSVNFT